MPSLFISAIGRHRSGKTELLCSQPKPLGLIVADNNTKYVLEKREDRSQIEAIEFLDYMDSDSLGDYRGELDRLRDTIVRWLTNPHIRSVGIDTGVQLWELCRYGLFGKETAGVTYDYKQANRWMKTLFGKIESSGKNCIITHPMGQVYKKTTTVDRTGQIRERSEPTDKWERSGWKWMDYNSPINVLMERGMADGTGWTESITGVDRRLVIRDCTQNPRLEGGELRWVRSSLGPDGKEINQVNFATIGMWVYPNSNWGDWI